MSFKDKITSVFKRNNDEDKDSNVFQQEPDDTDADNDNGIDIPEEPAPEEGAKTLKGRMIQIIVGVTAAVAIGAVVSNLMASPQKANKNGADNTDLSMSTRTNNPAAHLPNSYAEIAKYEKLKEKGNKQPQNLANSQMQGQQAGQVQQPTRTNYQPSYQPVYSAHPEASNSIGYVNYQKAQEQEKIAESPILFAITKLAQEAGDIADGTASAAPVYSPSGAFMNVPDASFVLNAGTVIPATLITGITSDVSSSDVVAQVRQDVYDSLTGHHLLIPQGSRIIGVSGTAGSRGNKRLGVVFKRIIFPNGMSFNLPDQKAVDGTGYPGLADKYDEHSSTLYRTAFLSALFAAAAQSATGDSGGYENRSPGQEAVSGAAASVLDTAQTIVERDANITPTINIQPGFQFSVFINQDFSLGEYYYE